MYRINCWEGVNDFEFGANVKEVVDRSHSFTDEVPRHLDIFGIQHLEYENAGVDFMFFRNKLTLISLNEGVVANVLGVDVKIGTTTRKEITRKLGSMLDLQEVELDAICSDSHGLVFIFEDENDEDEINSLWASNTTYSEHLATVKRTRSQELKSNPPVLKDSDNRLLSLAPVSSVLDKRAVSYQIDYDAIGWGHYKSSTYSKWIFRHYPLSENLRLETADLIKKYSSIAKLRKSNLLQGDEIDVNDRGILCWMNPKYPVVRAAVGDLIENLELFDKIDHRYWVISEPRGWVIEVNSKIGVQYLFSKTVTPMLDDEFLFS